MSEKRRKKKNLSDSKSDDVLIEVPVIPPPPPIPEDLFKEEEPVKEEPPLINYSKPLDEIICYPMKVHELYLGKKQIDELRDFEQFINLNILWLNGNRLKTVSGLDANTRIKELYLHDNQIEALKDSSLKYMKFIEVLHLHNNKFADLEDVIQVLSGMRFLKRLTLCGNPIADDPNYRSEILSRLPQLEVFDRKNVMNEKQWAVAENALLKSTGLLEDLPSNFSPTSTINSGKSLNSTRRSTSPSKVGRVSGLEEDLKREVLRIQREEQEKKRKEQELEEQRLRELAKPKPDVLPLPVSLDFIGQKFLVVAEGPLPTNLGSKGPLSARQKLPSIGNQKAKSRKSKESQESSAGSKAQ